MKVVRVFTGVDGRSHFEDLDITLEAQGPFGRMSALWPGHGVVFREVDGDYDLGFHNAPRRQLVVNLSGSVDIEVGDCTVRRLGPGEEHARRGRPGRANPALSPLPVGPATGGGARLDLARPGRPQVT